MDQGQVAGMEIPGHRGVFRQEPGGLAEKGQALRGVFHGLQFPEALVEGGIAVVGIIGSVVFHMAILAGKEHEEILGVWIVGDPGTPVEELPVSLGDAAAGAVEVEAALLQPDVVPLETANQSRRETWFLEPRNRAGFR